MKCSNQDACFDGLTEPYLVCKQVSLHRILKD